MVDAPESFALVSITWNQYGWKEVDPESDSKSQFSYVQKGGTAHEHLNFKFSKDHGKHVRGYAPAFHFNRRLRNDGNAVIFFISKDYVNNHRKIIGVYGNIELEDRRDENQLEYEKKGGFYTNIRAEKQYSILFPKPLNANKYEETKRMQQAKIMYITRDLAQEIISDEINECSNRNHKKKLYSIFNIISGNGSSDEKIQAFAEKKISEMSATNVRKILVKKVNGKKVTRTTTIYERDFEMTEAIKRNRGYACQVCHISIQRKDKPPYVEAAHITPKSKGGNETPKNIMILCPNHHTMFDIGNCKIISRSAGKIIIRANGETWPAIDLRVRP